MPANQSVWKTTTFQSNKMCEWTSGVNWRWEIISDTTQNHVIKMGRFTLVIIFTMSQRGLLSGLSWPRCVIRGTSYGRLLIRVCLYVMMYYFMYLRTDFCTFYMLLMPLGWMPTVWGHQKWTCTHKRIQWSCSEWCPVMAGHTSISWCSSVGLRACRLPYHIRITHSEHMHILNLRDCLLQCDLIHVFLLCFIDKLIDLAL